MDFIKMIYSIMCTSYLYKLCMIFATIGQPETTFCREGCLHPTQTPGWESHWVNEKLYTCTPTILVYLHHFMFHTIECYFNSLYL